MSRGKKQGQRDFSEKERQRKGGFPERKEVKKKEDNGRKLPPPRRGWVIGD